MSYESRIQTLEARLASSEMMSMAGEKKGDAQSGFFNDIIEKLEGKLQNVEQAMYFMKSEHKKEADNRSIYVGNVSEISSCLAHIIRVKEIHVKAGALLGI